jgi:rod shape-determining protein MreC
VLRFLRRFKMLIIVAGFLFVPVILLYVQRRAPAARQAMSGVVIDSTRGLQKGLLWISGGVSGFWMRYMSSVDSYDELLRLRGKTKELRTLKVALAEAEIENQRLRELVNFASIIEGPRMVGAQVIGRTGAPLSRTFQIDKGSKDGIARGDAVVSAAGVLGQVLLVGRRASEVLLVTDASSAIDVVVQRSRARGMLRGVSDTGRYALRISDFDRLHDVNEGDVVVTSGVGAKFPVGTPVGEVSAVRYHREGLYVEADIKPFTHFDRVEEVLVLTKGDKNKPWRRKEMAMELLEQSVGPDLPKKEP